MCWLLLLLLLLLSYLKFTVIKQTCHQSHSIWYHTICFPIEVSCYLLCACCPFPKVWIRLYAFFYLHKLYFQLFLYFWGQKLEARNRMSLKLILHGVFIGYFNLMQTISFEARTLDITINIASKTISPFWHRLNEPAVTLNYKTHSVLSPGRDPANLTLPVFHLSSFICWRKWEERNNYLSEVSVSKIISLSIVVVYLAFRPALIKQNNSQRRSSQDYVV